MTILVSLDELRSMPEAGPSRLAFPSTPQSIASGPRTPTSSRRRSKQAAADPTSPLQQRRQQTPLCARKGGQRGTASPRTFASPATDGDDILRSVVRQTKSARRIVVVSGAGVSTAASIPDFRSAAGLFKDKSKGKGRARGENMRDLFSVQCLSDDTLLPLHQELINDLCDMSFNAEPTAFHHLLKELDSQGRLLRCYTQNIDGLEAKAGLDVGVPTEDIRTTPAKRRRVNSPTAKEAHRAGSLSSPTSPQLDGMLDYEAFMGRLPPTPPEEPLPPPPAVYAAAPRVIPLHGQLDSMYCTKCFAACPTRDYLPLPDYRVACPRCTATSNLRRAMAERQRSVGFMRAGVVLYGEDHLQGDAIGQVSRRDTQGTGRRGEKEGRVDFLLVAGSSLTIPGVKYIIKAMAKTLEPVRRRTATPRVVFVNDEPPRGSDWEGVFDVWIKGDIQDFVRLLDDPVYAPALAEDPLTPRQTTPRKRKSAAASDDTPRSCSPSASNRLSRWHARGDVQTPTKIARVSAWYPTPDATPANSSKEGSVSNRDSPELTPVPEDWVPMSPTPPPDVLHHASALVETHDDDAGGHLDCIVPPDSFRARLRASTLRSSAETAPRRHVAKKPTALALDVQALSREAPASLGSGSVSPRTLLRIDTRHQTISVKQVPSSTPSDDPFVSA